MASWRGRQKRMAAMRAVAFLGGRVQGLWNTFGSMPVLLASLWLHIPLEVTPAKAQGNLSKCENTVNTYSLIVPSMQSIQANVDILWEVLQALTRPSSTIITTMTSRL